MRGAPPSLARPIAALPGDFDSDGITDLAVVNRYIDGSLQTGSVSVLGTQTGTTTSFPRSFPREGRPGPS